MEKNLAKLPINSLRFSAVEWNKFVEFFFGVFYLLSFCFKIRIA